MAIRARKPCVRLRLSMLGWNVLFMLRRIYLERADSKEEEFSSQRHGKRFLANLNLIINYLKNYYCCY